MLLQLCSQCWVTECMQLRWQAGRTALDNATLSNSAEVVELLQQEQQRVTALDTSSELMRLVCISPEPKECCTIEAYELETVLTVLKRVTVNLGLDEEDGKLLQMVFSEHVVPHDSTVQAAGLCNGSRFEVSLQAINIIKMRTTVLTDEECVAAQLGPGGLTCHWGEYTNGVRLVCEYAPERVNTDQDKVTAHCRHA